MRILRLVIRLLPADHLSAPGYARSFARWALAGLLLRLAIMPFTWSDDGAFLNSFASLLPEQGVLLVHTYLREHYAMDALGWSYYPLGTFVTFGAWQALVSPLAPGMVDWLARVREIYGEGGGYLPHYIWAAGDLPIFRFLFLLKLPYLLADCAIALLLQRLVRRSDDALVAHRLWMLNPVTLYATYAYGQFEIVEVLLMVASLLLAQRHKPSWAVFLLGVAATYKHIPLLLVLPTAILLAEGWRRTAFLVLLGLLPYASLRAISYLLAPGVEGAIGNPYLGASYFQLPASRLALALRLALPVAYLLLLLVLALRRRAFAGDPAALGRSWLIVLLLLLVGLTPIGAYWYVLLTPLWALECAGQRRLWKVLALHIVTLVPWTFSPGFNWGTVLAPLHPLFFPGLPTPEALVSNLIPWGYVALASWYLYVLLTLLLVAGLFFLVLRPQAAPQIPAFAVRAIWWGTIALPLALVAAVWVRGPAEHSQPDQPIRGVWQYRQPDTFTDLAPGRVIGQSFVSVLPNLTRIDLYLRPQHPDATPALRLRLFREGPGGEPVASASLEGDAGSSVLGRFQFPPQPQSAASRYYFEVTLPPGATTPVGVGWTPDRYAHLPTRGQRFEQGAPVEGDLAFDSFHAPEPAAVAFPQVAARLLSDVGFSLLDAGLLAACAGFLLRLSRKPRGTA